MKKINNPGAPDRMLFYTCFIALVTTSFGFILRALVLPQWGVQFNLTQTQLGEIAGVGTIDDVAFGDQSFFREQRINVFDGVAFRNRD